MCSIYIFANQKKTKFTQPLHEFPLIFTVNWNNLNALYYENRNAKSVSFLPFIITFLNPLYSSRENDNEISILSIKLVFESTNQVWFNISDFWPFRDYFTIVQKFHVDFSFDQFFLNSEAFFFRRIKSILISTLTKSKKRSSTIYSLTESRIHISILIIHTHILATAQMWDVQILIQMST